MKKLTLGAKLRRLFGLGDGNEKFFEDLEDILVEGDIGPLAAGRIVASLREELSGGKRDEEQFLKTLRGTLGEALKVAPLDLVDDCPNVFLVLGVNGVGKTTTIAKLAGHFMKKDKTVLLAAGDTFRAAAIDQISLWAERLGVQVVRQDSGADPGAVIFDAISRAQARNIDLLIADTAGRMHNKAHLVKELGKIDRIIRNRVAAQAYKRILVIDATTGQNALRQAEVFQEAVGIDSVVVAKYDSTAKGGIVVSISRDLGIPFSFMGIGEKVDDLVPFDKEEFLDSLIGGR
jgi:fused signal recognition particle receptor